MNAIIKHNCSFFAERTIFFTKRISHIDSGFTNPRIAYICKGSCLCSAYTGEKIELREGDVWFLPKSKPYASSWTLDSEGVVEFYFFEFDADFISFEYDTFQKIHMPSMLDAFAQLYEANLKGEKFRSISLFYEIIDKVVPCLKKSESEHYKMVIPALEYLYENYSEKIKIETLASLCALSQSRFHAVFKLAVGITPIEYKNGIKLSRAVEMIKNGNTLEVVCDELSFSSPAFLRRLIKKRFNLTPKEIRKTQNI